MRLAVITDFGLIKGEVMIEQGGREKGKNCERPKRKKKEKQ